MPAPRVVLDTSAALMPIVREKSSDAWIREYWEQGRLIPLISDDTAAELMRKVRDPRFGLTEEQAIAAAQVYLLYCERVEMGGAPPDTPRCRDPKDQPFIILAYQEQADFLVTKDEDILDLVDLSEITITTPAELRAEIDRSPG